ncbi:MULTISPECIES: CU044_5270 family protein [Thermomonospora]|uniref:CU044_5270 family protein n=1 Tax=Thermomonospora curvata (strain ATCC 19995 / DSM 43183 / JCM 3096 / KCTC 9072 / NBRC 15933 / NCIMB 10081 / Henssen B9) TaxID=471852 RepID=D1A392_THECD|nr:MULTISPECIES: CU044_5270 family protein [Thermomonospora]ACY99862.1 hypothetical protein Tcur_4335 [Thermomonospora curvata DSM 43183]PKK12865.1 MAG: hypothetical protein BUE48_021295 [Thermomonospora sp. CIF 1]
MDELTLVAVLHDQPSPAADPAPAVREEGRRRLLERAAGRSHRSRRPNRRTVLRLGLATTAAAVTTAGAVLLATASFGPAPSPLSHEAGGTPQARRFLLVAAERTARDQRGDGRYWHVAMLSTDQFRVGEPGARYTLREQQYEESWIGRTPDLPGLRVEQHRGVRPASAADAAAWKRAGSPRTVPVPALMRRGGSNFTLHVSGPRPAQRSAVSGDEARSLGFAPGFSMRIRMGELRHFPAEPARLRDHLARRYKVPDERLFGVLSVLLMELPVTPQVRAAAFRLMAGIEGVRVIEGIQPAAGGGRHLEGGRGTAVAVRVSDRRIGVIEQRLIIHPDSGRAVHTETVVVEPGGVNRDFAPGDWTHATTVSHAAWVDRLPE